MLLTVAVASSPGVLQFECYWNSPVRSWCCYCRLGQQAVIKTYHGAEHTGILGDDRMVADLLDILHAKGRVGNGLQRYVRGVIANLQGLWSSSTSHKAQRRLLAA